jgi:hypothetical protein
MSLWIYDEKFSLGAQFLFGTLLSMAREGDVTPRVTETLIKVISKCANKILNPKVEFKNEI